MLVLILLSIMKVMFVTPLQPIMSTVYEIQDYNYPVEVHEIVTKDGYILTTHRIPYGLKNNSTENRIPVIMGHGLLGASDNFVFLGPDRAISFMLADEGYDVWMPNARGNTHSRRHVHLNPNTDKDFWDFSWHEIGVIDLPTNIDYVLNKTKHNRLHYIGHSQGTTIFFVMLAKKPEYNDKIISMTALAPSAFLGHLKNPLVYGLSSIYESLDVMCQLLGIYEVVLYGSNNPLLEIMSNLCRISFTTEKICFYLFFVGAGYDFEEMDMSRFHKVLSMTAGSSTKQGFHYAQSIKSGLFREYDYRLDNYKHYGMNEPPNYNLSNVQAPVSLFHAYNDAYSTPEDVERLAKELPNLRLKYLVPYKKFSHNDFVFGINARKLVYEKTLEFMKRNEV